MKIDYNITHANVGHDSRDEVCRMSQDKGNNLTRNQKSCLRHATSKAKQRNLTSDSKQKVTEKLGERNFGNATIVKNRPLKNNCWQT